jgi:hypothetical protein
MRQCDRRAPGCSQCARMCIDCPGYPNPLDQRFRDESASVIRRAEKSYKSTTYAESSTTDRYKNDSACVNPLYISEVVPLSILDVFRFCQPVEDTAVAHLMSCFIPGSHFNYLSWMYGQAGTDCALVATIHAASMAYLSRELRQSNLMDTARRLYARALLMINSALADPCTAASDSTLISVLLLSLFEALIWTHPRTPESWTTHTNGALAIIKIRGSGQLESPVGRQLFLQVMNIVCVNSLQRRVRVPQELVDLVQAALQKLQYGCATPQYELASLTSQVSNLIAEVYAGDMNVVKLLEATRSMDEQYVSFAGRLPPAWHYLEIPVEKSRPDVYGNTIHQYPNHRTAQLWNSCRMIRVWLNEIIYKYAACLPTAARQTTQQEAVDNIEEMATQICASIHQFTGRSEFPASIKASAASLLWPLSAVRGASLASEDIRTYAVERLKHLGSQSRVSQVEAIARKNSDFDALQDGLHMFYVS